MSLEARLNDPEYQNWLKCGQALLLVVNSLRKFAEETVSTYHGDLKQELGQLGTCQQACKAKKKPPDTCAICSQWKQKLMEKHKTKQVHWTNVDPKSWPHERWEVAKLYMARGQKPNMAITADDLDSTHMLNLIKNCKEFHIHVPQKLPEKVLQKRNKIMHSSNMKLSNNDLTDIFDLFIQFLEDKTKLHELPETKQAAEEIQQLKKAVFDVSMRGHAQAGSPTKAWSAKDTQDLEHKLISTMMEDFNKRLEAFEDMEESFPSDSSESKDLSKNIEDLQNFVNSNLDLKEVFGQDLESLKQKYAYLEERVEAIDEKMEEIEEGCKEMNIRLEAMETKPLPGTEAADYVSLLQQVTDELKIDKPVYAFTPEEQGKTCCLTVNGKDYRTPQAYRNKHEAKQAAAETAYKILKMKIKSGQHKPMSQVDDPSNYVGMLQEYTQKRGLPKPEYSPKNKNTVGMQFTVAVYVELSDGQTVASENPEPEKTLQGAKKAAARQVLEELQRLEKQQQRHQPHSPKEKTTSDNQPKVALDKKSSEPDGTNYKGKLQEHQQKSGLTKPTYNAHKMENDTFMAEVIVPLPNDKTETFECESACNSKKEAEHAAARKALEKLVVLEEVKQPEAKAPVPKPKIDAGAKPKVKPEKVAAASSPDSTCGSSAPNFKGQLQQVLMQSHAATSPPKYEDVEISSQPEKFRSKVTISAKHMLQSGQFSSKKEAEKSVARLALEQLEIKGWEQLPNPKGKLLELPPPKPMFVTEQVLETKEFQSTLFLSALEKVNEVVIFGDEVSVSKTKKELQNLHMSVAKKVLEYLEHLNEKC